ncbi:MAG TPA: MerR family transcriptional regulator [Gaiellaceae bacterium]|nr:MerR family transcriptional regulator [Gaiellaceae bacterium]
MAERGRPLFSIGAVARMLDLSPATIRTWESRYGLVVPERSEGGQRLYSRDQVDQIRFVRDEIEMGRRPSEAHRLLQERIARGDSFGGTRLRVLLAESRLGVAALLRRLLGGEGFEVVLAGDAEAALRACEDATPAIVVVDTADAAFSELTARLRADGTKILPIELLERPFALLDQARELLER